MGDAAIHPVLEKVEWIGECLEQGFGCRDNHIGCQATLNQVGEAGIKAFIEFRVRVNGVTVEQANFRIP